VLPAWAQGPPALAPELKKLDYFVGSWTTDFDLKLGPGAKCAARKLTNGWMAAFS
jgi:hypothetical protein